MISRMKLPMTYDVSRLKEDLGRIEASEWVAHFNKDYYKGDWSVAALRSVGGVSGQIYPDPTKMDQFADTPLLDRCPYYAEILRSFQCPLLSARLLSLSSGSRIREHQDYNLGYEDGEIRVHIPVQTHPDVAFVLDGEPLPMEEGEAWYIDFNLPHLVDNESPIDRTHLVIDMKVNAWVRSFFPDERKYDVV